MILQSRLCATAACRAEDACSEYRRSTWQQRVRLVLLDWQGADVEVLSLLHVGEGVGVESTYHLDYVYVCGWC